MDLREINWGVWSGFTWLRIGTVGGLLWMRWRTFGFWLHGISYILSNQNVWDNFGKEIRAARKTKEQWLVPESVRTSAFYNAPFSIHTSLWTNTLALVRLSLKQRTFFSSITNGMTTGSPLFLSWPIFGWSTLKTWLNYANYAWAIWQHDLNSLLGIPLIWIGTNGIYLLVLINEVSQENRKLHGEELHTSYSVPNIRLLKWPTQGRSDGLGM
jgi:hypothetical protein